MRAREDRGRLPVPSRQGRVQIAGVIRDDLEFEVAGGLGDQIARELISIAEGRPGDALAIPGLLGELCEQLFGYRQLGLDRLSQSSQLHGPLLIRTDPSRQPSRSRKMYGAAKLIASIGWRASVSRPSPTGL